MPLLDLEALSAAPLVRDPFTFTVVPNAIRVADAESIRADFPVIADSGLLPVEATSPGQRFRDLIAELRSVEVAKAFSEKFGVNLVGRPQMITVRGRCAAKDGRIHTDSETKLITVLIYFNDAWEAKGVTAPIASATSLAQLESLIEATRVALSAEDVAALEAASAP